ncbi:transcriptional regulator, TetR family [Sanguibacter gelidistatuariae]|uniref:Transcriptional regulator, TetR family n=1 Tax=Sanguibacter gelidistatuariae TaxID=1814289 RepID=A0A1G6U9M0_9MICO|nr:TetR family transcriptional regulator [Sanguibacter gelidistatuariae]SDD38068.1 transcriptional regulator, TetR family [Sanguibacter gelidistatuariae]
MRIDGKATKARILDAARIEFAEHGLAGARVDRIAAAAHANKERLYAYFGDKRSLFLATIEENIDMLADAIIFTPEDLPGFAGAVFDHVSAHPEHARILSWARLEGEGDAIAAAKRILQGRDGHTVAAAQADGAVDPRWHEDDLITMLFAVATGWEQTPGLFASEGSGDSDIRARRREGVVLAACKMVAP